MIIHLILEVLKNATLITGLVVVMMMLIEYINVFSSGKWFSKLQSSKPKQVLLGALLGIVPGCIGGFAAVSLYSHRLISFGALIAMMIASSGDEAFVMLAMIPKEAMILFGILFVIAIGCGLLVDKFYKGKPLEKRCDPGFQVHIDEHTGHSHGELPSILKASSYKTLKHPSKERIILLLGIALFITAIFSGILEHEHTETIAGMHNHSHEEANVSFNILNERWLNIIFALISVVALLFTATANEHFIKDHIWSHVIKKHATSIFLWTFGVLAVIQIGMQYINIEPWIKDNYFIVILIAALVGMIPESGPHMIFITMFAGGIVPFSVLLTSSIAQDGHTTLPLLASSKKSFVMAKLFNAIFAIIIGSIFLLCGF